MKNNQVENWKRAKASGLRGLLVISNKEGKQIGKVSHVLINPEERRLSGIVVKDEFWKMPHLHIPITEIESIGEDVVFIKSDLSCIIVDDIDKLPGVFVKDLRGRWVTTQDGRHLGQFHDANFSKDSWKISELLLDEERIIQVNPAETYLGVDEILVPSSYVLKIKKQSKTKAGILARLFGEEKTDNISHVFKRKSSQNSASLKDLEKNKKPKQA